MASKFTTMRQESPRVRGGRVCTCGARVKVTRGRRGGSAVQPHICANPTL